MSLLKFQFTEPGFVCERLEVEEVGGAFTRSVVPAS